MEVVAVENHKESLSRLDRTIFIFLLLVIGITPLIILTGRIEFISPLISRDVLLASGEKWDIFTYYKAFFTLLMTGILSILFLVKIIFKKEKFRNTPLNFVITIFIIAILVSTLLSPNVSIAMNGLYSRHDGAISWVCYLILFFIAMNSKYPKNITRYIGFTLYPLVLINLLIISMNFLGYDLLQYQWMKNLLFWYWPAEYILDDSSLILGTLNQWNFMSGMFSIMSVLFVTLALLEKAKLISILHFLVSLAAMIIVLMSISTSGSITILCLIPFLLIFAWKSKRRTVNFVMISIFCIAFVSSSYGLSQVNDRVWNESFGFFKISNLQKVLTSGTGTGKNDQVVEVTVEEKSTDGFRLPVLPEPHTSAGSGRIYIWVKTLELAKERPLWGYGLDSILYNFPHFNIDARAGLSSEYTFVDKPHNTFLGVLYGVGFFGFLCYIVIISALCGMIWQLLKTRDTLNAIPFAFASLAFFIQGIFNDSTPEIATVSWVLLGITFALSTKKETLSPNTN